MATSRSSKNEVYTSRNENRVYPVNTMTKVPINDHYNQSNDGGFDICGWILIICSCILIAFTSPITVVQEYERAVIFRLGRILQGGAKGPGLFFIVPCVDTIKRVDLRTTTFNVPPQEILTRDSVTVSVDAVVYSRIVDPVKSFRLLDKENNIV
ncbi:unnamed protein product [Adineta steineri]|uniref:Band 7 domain-containing protein n=1 Tax=Adineta steineri TaxID=433720 RepID=A0A819QSV3_9BILA|nr:unnamed protein product [Adineta steineri]CAF4036643.1 unnamed protein product [Adineta steineri]